MLRVCGSTVSFGSGRLRQGLHHFNLQIIPVLYLAVFPQVTPRLSAQQTQASPYKFFSHISCHDAERLEILIEGGKLSIPLQAEVKDSELSSPLQPHHLASTNQPGYSASSLPEPKPSSQLLMQKQGLHLERVKPRVRMLRAGI